MERDIELSKEQKNEDKYLIAKVLDRIKFANNKNRIEATDFLDLRQKSILEETLLKFKYSNYEFYGGYSEAERKVLVIFSENIDKNYIKEEIYNQFVEVLSIVLPNELKGQYQHRNYLGAIMKLGIKREKIGDILVRDDGADIIVKRDISEYVMNNIKQLTRFKKAKIEIKDIVDLIIELPKKELLKIVVPSMRLDCIVGELVRCSRKDANEYLLSERVFVNFKEEIKSSFNIKEGDYITIRGKGRFKINKIIGETRKGKISVEIEK